MNWEDLEYRLMNLGLSLHFSLNGHKISIYRFIKNSKIELLVFIDGKGVAPGRKQDLKEDWYALVLNKRTSFIHSTQMRKKIIKKLGKREAKKFGVDDKITYYSTLFTSFRTLKSQYSKIEGLEYVED